MGRELIQHGQQLGLLEEPAPRVPHFDRWEIRAMRHLPRPDAESEHAPEGGEFEPHRGGLHYGEPGADVGRHPVGRDVHRTVATEDTAQMLDSALCPVEGLPAVDLVVVDQHRGEILEAGSLHGRARQPPLPHFPLATPQQLHGG